MVRREDIPWEELQRLNAQGWSYRRLAEKYGVSSSAIGRQAVLESWHGTNVFCTYLTNSFLALRPCCTNPSKCQPPLFRPADSVHNTRTFVFVRSKWTGIGSYWKYLP